MSRRYPATALVAVLFVGCSSPGISPKTITYFVAAEPVSWSYAPLGRDPAMNRPIPDPWGARLEYPKVRYFQYTDDRFSTRLDTPAWAGILGPTLRATVGDTLKVVFLNRTDRPLSMHPHGLRYAPESEGAPYEPGGAARGVAAPGARLTYTWIVDENAGPIAREPSSKVWLYHSHVNADEDIYRGLVGTIVVTDPKRSRPDRTPADIDQEFATLFMVWNENAHDTPEPDRESNLKHAINGRFFANLQGLDMKAGERVRWYIVALGNEVDLHTAHWHGETVTTELGLRTDVVELLPASMRVVDMHPRNPGTWLFHCHVSDHMMAGMFTTFTVHK